MKKGVLILLGIVMMVSTVEAKNGNYLPNSNRDVYAYNNAVNFVERGVSFFIYTNGDFDFNTRSNNAFFNRNGIRIQNNNARISRDLRGRINRIGNISIRYDFRGNVARIGNVNMRYFRNRLTNVGNLFVSYDRWGNPFFNGEVRDHFYNYNGINVNINLGRICNFNDAYFYRSDFKRNYTQFREDNRYFYYRANRSAANGNRGEILRRRKPAKLLNYRNSTTRNSNNSYRRINKEERRVRTNSRNATTIRNKAKKTGNVSKNIRKSSNTNSKRNTNIILKNSRTTRKIKADVKRNKAEKTNSRVRRNTNIKDKLNRRRSN